MHRQDHVRDEVLQDYIEKRLDSKSAVSLQHHLANCSRCHSEWEFWNKLQSCLQEGASNSAPEPVIQRALALYDSLKPRPSFKERLLAALIFDSRNQPVLAGARDLQDSAFKLLFETQEAHVDLFCEREQDSWRLSGQVLCNPYPETGWRIELNQETHHRSLMADEFGEFLFLNLPDGDYALTVQSVDREIVLPTIHLS